MKSNIVSWAENEIEKVTEKLDPKKDKYMLGCLKSALKAYKSLAKANHSGASWNITSSILYRLCCDKPLSPLEDTPESWVQISDTEFQHRRLSSLFKDIDPNTNEVKYTDTERVVCIDINTTLYYHSGLVTNVINKMYPIAMPYYPTTNSIEVYCEEFLADPEKGDFDTIHIHYAILPDNKEKVEINKYFNEENGKMVEIDQEKFNILKDIANKRKETKDEN